MAFNASTDFHSIEKGIEHEISKQLDAEISDLNITSKRELSKDLAQGIGNSSKLFDTAIFSLLKIRHENIKAKKRYLSIDRFHVSFHDRGRPFAYPEWILCRQKVFFWKLCEIHLPKRAFDINQKGMTEEIPDPTENLESTDLDYLITDKYVATGPANMLLMEAINILDAAYGYDQLLFDEKDSSLILRIHSNEYKVTIKSAFLYKNHGYLIIDKIKKENEIFPDCHACPGNLSIIRYTINNNGLEIESILDDFSKTGVWGDSGTVFPVIYSDKKGAGFIVTNGSMWQGTTVTWVDAYKIQKDQIIPMPELSQKKQPHLRRYHKRMAKLPHQLLQ